MQNNSLFNQSLGTKDESEVTEEKLPQPSSLNSHPSSLNWNENPSSLNSQPSTF